MRDAALDLNARGRCAQCTRRWQNGESLIGGICKKCWDDASSRIRERFASESDGELRYSYHGHAHAFHGKKRNSTPRAESTLGHHPSLVGRGDNGAVDLTGTASAPTVADTGAGSRSAPSLWVDPDPKQIAELHNIRDRFQAIMDNAVRLRSFLG